MVVPAGIAACTSGAGPSSPQNLVPPHVPDDGQTFAANPFAPSVGHQYMPPMQPLYFPPPNYVMYEYNGISEKDRKIADQQNQLHENNEIISELKRKLEEEKGEVSAKDSSLREKEAELATCRRNLDHCETEKCRLQEMHRASQGSIIHDNERLNMELAHCVAWSNGQSIAIQSLQAQLEACTVQVNQLWFDRQRQSAEVERLKRLAQQLQDELANYRRLAQQLRLEMTNASERTQTHPDESRIPQNDSQDVTQLGQNNGNLQDVSGSGSMNANSGVLPNGDTDNATSFVSSGNASIQAALQVSQISAPSQTDQNLTRSDAECESDTSVDGRAPHLGNLYVHISPETEPDSVISPSSGEEQVLSQENDTKTILLVFWGSTGLASEIRLRTIEQDGDAKEQENVNSMDHALQGKVAKIGEPSFAAGASLSL